jgi:hypothetical protein
LRCGCWGFGIEPSHTQRMESGYAKDAGSKTPKAADCISTFQASRFGKHPSSTPKPSAQIQLNAGRRSFAWQLIPRRSPWGECYPPRGPRPGIRTGGFVVPNTY